MQKHKRRTIQSVSPGWHEPARPQPAIAKIEE